MNNYLHHPLYILWYKHKINVTAINRNTGSHTSILEETLYNQTTQHKRLYLFLTFSFTHNPLFISRQSRKHSQKPSATHHSSPFLQHAHCTDRFKSFNLYSFFNSPCDYNPDKLIKEPIMFCPHLSPLRKSLVSVVIASMHRQCFSQYCDFICCWFDFYLFF